MDEIVGAHWRPQTGFRPPETPIQSMEFLSRTWSAAALEVSRAITSLQIRSGDDVTEVPEDDVMVVGEEGNDDVVLEDTLTFTSSETSHSVMERIMAQSPAISSPRTSGRLSHSCDSFSDSPQVSVADIDDCKQTYCTNPSAGNPRFKYPSFAAPGGSKTVGRWLKDRKEKKREEARAHNAQLHSAVSVAGVAVAVAAIAAATASQSSSGKDREVAKTDAALASAATLVAAQCVEAAEALGADREHLADVINSAVTVRSAGDIMTLTAAAATALRGEATLKARTLKEAWNIAAVIPVAKESVGTSVGVKDGNFEIPDDDILGICSRDLLAKGCDLLKRTRKGDLHWKVVSLHLNRRNQVVMNMKSKHVVGTFTKKRKNVVVGIVKEIEAWPGREMVEGGENRRYFGVKTMERRVIEFECRSQREYDLWVQGVSGLLSFASERKRRC